jgi:hypothetical protein
MYEGGASIQSIPTTFIASAVRGGDSFSTEKVSESGGAGSAKRQISELIFAVNITAPRRAFSS